VTAAVKSELLVPAEDEDDPLALPAAADNDDDDEAPPEKRFIKIRPKPSQGAYTSLPTRLQSFYFAL
jgi:hypothetical protein